MKHLFLLILVVFSRLAFADDVARCVDGDANTSNALFAAKAFLSASEGKALMPEVDYDTDGKPTGIKWTPAESVRRVETVIGRYDGRDVVDTTFYSVGDTNKNSSEPFSVKLLAYRTEPSVTSPLQPFFIVRGDNVRWYEQTIEGAPNEPFCLTVSLTIPGNGVMWSNFTFRFGKRGAWIEHICEGGRKMQTTTMTFTANGQLKKLEKSDENRSPTRRCIQPLATLRGWLCHQPPLGSRWLSFYIRSKS